MSRLEDYLHQRESEHLEFKGADAVDDPRVVPRAVCALLNASGGLVVVGLKEIPGGLELDPIANADQARVRLRDRLLSSIEPAPPLGLEVRVTDDGRGLEVSVPASDQLHALREKKGAYSFVRRSDDRTHSLSWNEARQLLRDRFGAGPRASAQEVESERERAILEELEKWESTVLNGVGQAPRPGMMLLVARVFPESLSPDPGRQRQLEEWYRDPTRIGLRRQGWTFLTPYSLPERRRRRRGYSSSGDWESGYMLAEYGEHNGEFHCATRLEPLRSSAGGEDTRALHPLALIEMIVAATTVFSALWKGTDSPAPGGDPPSQAWFAFEMIGTRGVSLPPYRHDSHAAFFQGHWEPPFEDERLAPIVVRADLTEFLESPQRLAWSLVRMIYQDFGYDEAQIPYFDPRLEQFVFE